MLKANAYSTPIGNFMVMNRARKEQENRRKLHNTTKKKLPQTPLTVGLLFCPESYVSQAVHVEIKAVRGERIG